MGIVVLFISCTDYFHIIGKMEMIFNFILISFISSSQANFGTLWDNFVEVAKLKDVVSRMETLIVEADPDMINLKFFLSNETRPIAECLRNSTEYLEFYEFLEANGMDLVKIFGWINDQLGWGEYIPPVKDKGQQVKELQVKHVDGLKGLWTDLVSIIPEQELLAWYLEMMAVNLDMQLLMDRIKKPETEKIRNILHMCDAYLNYRCHFLREGINLIDIETQACNNFEWSDCSIYKNDC